jgi:tripartite motif-containing protein 71
MKQGLLILICFVYSWLANAQTAIMVKDINPNGNGAQAVTERPIMINGIIYFIGLDNSHGMELWKSDGTKEGTVLVKDISPGITPSWVNSFTNYNGMLFFRAYSDTNGTELWKSDGTEAGTTIVKDIIPGSGSGEPAGFTLFNNMIYFSAINTNGGRHLWRSDGTEEGTQLVSDIFNIELSSPNSQYKFAIVNQIFYFFSKDQNNTRGLWKSDGTSQGTELVKQFTSDSYIGRTSSTLELVQRDDDLFFAAREDGNGTGFQLWKSDGTEVGTTLIKYFAPPLERVIGTWYIMECQGKVFFTTYDPDTGFELWKSDGTPEGTVLVKDINPGVASSYAGWLVNIQGTLFFLATDGIHGDELWKSDGTWDGTLMVKDINPGTQSGVPVYVTLANGRLYFSAQDGIHGNELWQSDGTSAGTNMYKDINPGAAGSSVLGIVQKDTTLFFIAEDGIHGWELWKTSPYLNQTIHFPSISAKTFGDQPFSLNATTSSGLPVSYSIAKGPATITDSIATIIGAGTITIRASQKGADPYKAADSVEQTFIVSKAPQVITFSALYKKLYGDTPFTLQASSSSNLTITFVSSNTKVATVSGNLISILGPGTTSITASQAGDANYNPAVSVLQTLIVKTSVQNQASYIYRWQQKKEIPVPVLNTNSLASPADVALSGGKVYIADSFNNRIQVYTSNGNFLQTIGSYGSGNGQLQDPEGIAVNSQGNIYVADAGNSRIQIFSSDGTFLNTLGSPGSEEGQFSYISDIAIDAQGRLYIADSGNNRIQIFSSTGTFISSFGSAGTGDGQFNNPEGIDVDAQGNIYVTDAGALFVNEGHNRIQKFNSNGIYLTQFGGYGSEMGQLIWPQGVAVDNQGNIYVADAGNSRIQIFSSDGTFLNTFGSFGSEEGFFTSLQGLAIDGTGTLFIADAGNNRIQILSQYGQFISEIGSETSSTPLPAEDEKFLIQQGITVDSKGAIYLADAANHRIQKFSSNNQLLLQFGSFGSENGQLNNPSGIAIDTQGNIYVVDKGNHRIQAFSSDGAYKSQFYLDIPPPNEFTHPISIAIDWQNSLYLSDRRNHRILKFTSDGTLINQFGQYGSGNGQFIFPQGIAIDSEGNVWVADSWNHRIQKFTKDGTYLKQFGTNGSKESQFNYPVGISLDSHGFLYISEWGNSRFQKFDSNGIYITQFGTNGSGNGQFSKLQGLAVDSLGNVYVDEIGNNRIQKLSPFGPAISIKQEDTQIYTNESKNFGNVQIKSSKELVFTVFNQGTTPLQLSNESFTIRGTDAASFKVDTGSTTSSLQPDSSINIKVIFNPLNIGFHIATLSIRSNDPLDSLFYIHLSGDGIKINQSITFDPIPNKRYGDAPFVLSASASSGLLVSFKVVSGPATLLENTLTLTGVGPLIIKASQAGDSIYDAANDQILELVIQPTLSTVALSGAISTSLGTPIKGVSMKGSDGVNSQQKSTLSDGAYALDAPEGSPYTITASKNNDSNPASGVTTLDLLLIRRHILQKEELDSPYKIIAADANSSGSVTTLDIALINSLILLDRVSFPGNKLWNFVNSDFTFRDPANPFPFDSTRSFTQALAASNQNFIGVKLGDVNDSWDKSGARIASEGEVEFNLADQTTLPNAEIVVPVKVSAFNQIGGYQFTLNWDANVLHFQGADNKALNGSYGLSRVTEGKLTTTWYDAQGKEQTLPEGETIFQVRFKVIGGLGSQSHLTINSSLTQSMAYSGELAQLAVLSQQKKVAVHNAETTNLAGYQLFQNQPNPFQSSTTIRFTIPTKQAVNLVIYNTLGQVVTSFQGEYEAGENHILWDGRSKNGSLVGTGTYYYQISTNSYTKAKQLLYEH